MNKVLLNYFSNDEKKIYKNKKCYICEKKQNKLIRIFYHKVYKFLCLECKEEHRIIIWNTNVTNQL